MDLARQLDANPAALDALRQALLVYMHGSVEPFRQVCDTLDRRVTRLQGAVSRLRWKADAAAARVDAASEDDDIAFLLQELEDAQQAASEAASWLEQLDDDRWRFASQARAYEELLSATIPAAQAFLSEKIEALLRVGHVRFDDVAPTAPSRGTPSPIAGSEVSAPAESAPEQNTDISDFPLPPGFRWVRLSEVDLDRELDGVSGPSDFEKVDYGAMKYGLESLRNEILPELARNPALSTSDVASRDRAAGRDYEHGLQRVFDAFFGRTDFVYFVRRKDGGLDLINGRHRVRMALDLGWGAIPAQVREL